MNSFEFKPNMGSKNLILSIIIFGLLIPSQSLFSQTLGTITTASTSCSVEYDVCDEQVIELAPTDIVNFTNFKWYFGSVDPANEITGTSAAQHVTAYDGTTSTIEVDNQTTSTSTNTYTYIVTAEYASPAGLNCPAKNDTVILNFYPTPDISTTDDAICDGESIDLSTLVTDAADHPSGTLTFYTSLSDAENESGAVGPTVSPTTTTEYYVRSETVAAVNSCFDIDSLTITVNPLPTATNASLTECETTAGNPDDFNFTLSNATSTVLGGQSGMTVTYHSTQADADSGSNAITSITATDGTTVYARVENSTTGCYETSEVTLNVNERPDFSLSLPDVCPGEDPTVAITLGDGADADPTVSVNSGGGFSYSTLSMGILETANGIVPDQNNTVVLTNSNGCDHTETIAVPAVVPKVCVPIIISIK